MMVLIILGCVFLIIPLTLAFLMSQGSTAGTPSTTQKIYFLCAVSVVAALVIGTASSYVIFAFLSKWFLPTWIKAILTFASLVMIIGICGFAIEFVKPTTNANLAYGIILTSFLCLAVSMTISHYREDNFDPETGKSQVWVTPSSGKLWYEKDPSIKFDPKTGEKLEQASAEDVLRAEEVKKDSTSSAPAEQPFTLSRGRYEYQLAAGKTSEEHAFRLGDGFSIECSNFPYTVIARDGREFEVDSDDYKLPKGIDPFRVRAGSSLLRYAIIVSGV